jgi:hypothetical protein
MHIKPSRLLMQVCQEGNPSPVLRVSDPRQDLPQSLDAFEESVCGRVISDSLVNFVAERINSAIAYGCSDDIIRSRADKTSGFIGDLHYGIGGTPPGAGRNDPHILGTRGEYGRQPGRSHTSIKQPGERGTELRQPYLVANHLLSVY